jgi:hypothetical protein
MEQHWEKIIEAVGEDLQRPGFLSLVESII